MPPPLTAIRSIVATSARSPTAIVETRIHEFHMENRGENIMSKDKLLAVGDRYEAMIAADKAADAKYR